MSRPQAACLPPNGAVSNAFGIRYTNTHVLIDSDGNLVGTIPGDIQEADIVSLINQTVPAGQSYLPNPKEQCQIASNGQKEVCSNAS